VRARPGNFEKRYRPGQRGHTMSGTI
jgi:hypothetical protein